ncbi:gluconate 2-dehydrogenase subunit 3 family protein [Sphingobacterium hungaricum]|uniref:Twin-arginine translocation pathway signal protein n=1 Tax=Sphingobacterium hungaricum TaxID=2082723 RepID=A0A928US50_9SPHI|nr:gluconate 2-dehydrogenase subunit 3 family protein [Sphingobacterium hungaricum]MBE8712291.1 twin-arginine translocation pathway signal protein [Sphingobacterium hungaricum]
MNRREAIQRVAFLVGGSVIGANLFLEGCTRSASKDVAALFEKESTDLLGDLAEAILPKTSTPGAKEAGVGEFIPVMIRDCYTVEDQKAFLDGFSKVDERANKEFGKKFQELSKEQQLQFVNTYDKEAQEYQKNKKDGDANHFFNMFKQLTLTGFFTSEVGMTKALRFVKVPGKFDGNYPYKKGDRAFSA